MSDAAASSKPAKPSAVWKYLGAALMDKKGGHYAIGVTRVCMVLFAGIMAFGFIKKIIDTGEIDSQLVYVFMSLVGAKGVKDGANSWKGNGA